MIGLMADMSSMFSYLMYWYPTCRVCCVLPMQWIYWFLIMHCCRKGNTLLRSCTLHLGVPGVESTSGNSVCPFICLSVITSHSFPYSDSKLTQPPAVNHSQVTSPMVSNVPHPCLPCPPVNWSPNEQDHIADLTSPIWSNYHFLLRLLSYH